MDLTLTYKRAGASIIQPIRGIEHIHFFSDYAVVRYHATSDHTQPLSTYRLEQSDIPTLSIRSIELFDLNQHTLGTS